MNHRFKHAMSEITIQTALSLFLENLTQPVVTDYQLGLFLYHLYRQKKFHGYDLKLPTDTPPPGSYDKFIEQWLASDLLRRYEAFPRHRVFSIFGRRIDSIEEVICAVDPFAYLSHLSAMDYHGLTILNPGALYVSTPTTSNWKELAIQRMQSDLDRDYPHYNECRFPLLRPIPYENIGKRQIVRSGSLHYGAYLSVSGRCLRVSSLGRTFLDMLRAPQLCGSIRHVLEAYQQHAARYITLIVAEIDRNGQPIDKVRAGYILEERCGLGERIPEAWREFVQRGGSRKLDPSAEYSPHFSERWSLSLNVVE